MSTKQADNRWQQNSGSDFLQLVGEGGNVLAGIDPSGVGYGGLAGGATSVKVSVSSAEILSLNAATPTVKTLIPGVAGSVITPFLVSCHYKAGSTPYTVAPSDFLYFEYNNGGLVQGTAISLGEATFIDQATNQFAFGTCATSGTILPDSYLSGADFILTATQPPTNGNGTFDVTIWYYLVKL